MLLKPSEASSSVIRKLDSGNFLATQGMELWYRLRLSKVPRDGGGVKRVVEVDCSGQGRKPQVGTRGGQNVGWLWGLMGTYVGADVLFLLAGLYPGHVPIVVSVELHIFPPLLFALLHGAKVYGWRGILTFTGLCMGVGNLFENLSIATGFPFGHYAFTERMGPKILEVPVLLGLAYVGMGYLSWTVAQGILGTWRNGGNGWRLRLLPLLASVVMTAWDVAMDPVWSTVGRLWIWKQGGAYFGVPVSNFLGWLLTNYVIYQLFAWFVLRGRPREAGLNGDGETGNLPAGYWRMAVVFYTLAALGNLLLGIPTPRHPVISDATGAAWRVSDITTACAVASLGLMGGFALSAWLRLGEAKREDEPSVSG